MGRRGVYALAVVVLVSCASSAAFGADESAALPVAAPTAELGSAVGEHLGPPVAKATCKYETCQENCETTVTMCYSLAPFKPGWCGARLVFIADTAVGCEPIDPPPPGPHWCQVYDVWEDLCDDFYIGEEHPLLGCQWPTDYVCKTHDDEVDGCDRYLCREWET